LRSEGKHDLSLTYQFTLNCGGACSFDDLPFHPGHFEFKAQLITGFDLALEPAVVDACKQPYAVAASFRTAGTPLGFFTIVFILF
jgi:hypothetical protein